MELTVVSINQNWIWRKGNAKNLILSLKASLSPTIIVVKIFTSALGIFDNLDKSGVVLLHNLFEARSLYFAVHLIVAICIMFYTSSLNTKSSSILFADNDESCMSGKYTDNYRSEERCFKIIWICRNTLQCYY